MNPAPSWHKYSWFAEFIAAIPRYRANTIATTRMAIQARQLLFDIAEKEKIDFGLERRGILHLYNDRAAFEHGLRVSRLLQEGGLERRTVTSAEMRVIEPALTHDYYGGIFTPDDATGDIHRFTRGLAAACTGGGASCRKPRCADCATWAHGSRSRSTWARMATPMASRSPPTAW